MDHSSHKICVVLTVLNEGKGMSKLLDSLLNQSLTPDEIIIVDGGSTDGTIENLKQYSDKIVAIKYFVEEGVNIAKGRNIAISKAMGDIIAVTDGGCIPENKWLEELITPLLFNSSLGAVAGYLNPVFDTRFELFAGLLSLPTYAEDETKRMFYGRSSAFRREVWEKSGGYPEWLYTAEDSLFAKKVLQLGYRVGYAPGSILSWKPRSTLRKFFKMFFLYGRGQGRINDINLNGCFYWLKYYFVLILSMVLGFLYPYSWILSTIVILYLYKILVFKQMPLIRSKSDDRMRELYVPVMIVARNISSNLGSIFGYYEYKRNPIFKKKLDEYTLQ